uniref:Uncharacterized protein n=1 Tax=Oryza punctata TaxID=4537 RepID=A0A0E0LEI7_ORYPU
MCRCAAAIAWAVVEFLDAILLGCFLSFFRLHPRPRDRDDSPPGSGRRDSLAHKDRLGEMLSDDELGFGGREGPHEDLADDCGNDEELRSEANFLKLCGTLSETPVELHNISYQINMHDKIPTNVLVVEATPAFESKSSEGQCSFEYGEGHILTPQLNTEDTEHLLLVESVYQSAVRGDSPFQNLGASDSPFPTPLVLRDDMQTPRTVYTSHKGSSGKFVRTHKQFVYPITRPTENELQQMQLSDSMKKPQQISAESVVKGESLNSSPLPFEVSKYQLGPQRLFDAGERSKSNLDEDFDVCSLSRWLKSSPAGNENQMYDENNLIEEGHAFMASEDNWDAESRTPRLCKAWDCHGIPNTTRKYGEDQHVSWHSTPFEERLIKVLSEEEVPPTGKLVPGSLLYLDERV